MTEIAFTGRSRWPHRFAVCLALATFPLIWVGGLVTTYDAGMSVPDWPTTYGYNMFAYPISTWLFGPWDLFIEHGHRLLGVLAGLLTIALNVAIWRCDVRRWMRWVGIAALVLVVVQGLLGGLRVRMESTDLARIHGCAGPLFFAYVVVICVVTSRFWHEWAVNNCGVGKASISAGWFVFLIAYVQLVLGAYLRHPGTQWSPTTFRTIVFFHVVIACFLVLQSLLIAWTARRLPSKLRSPALLLVVLVSCQFLLGVATWRAKYGWPSFLPMIAENMADGPAEIAVHSVLAGATITAESMAQTITVTGHVAVGSLVLAATCWYATRLTRTRLDPRALPRGGTPRHHATSTLSTVAAPESALV